MRTGHIEGTIVCELDQEYFTAWHELTPEQQAIFKDRATRCDGIGDIGFSCLDCGFCHDSELTDAYEVEEEG